MLINGPYRERLFRPVQASMRLLQRGLYHRLRLLSASVHLRPLLGNSG